MILFAAVILASCNRPSVEFRGIEPMRISVAQSTFDVRLKGLRAEAIRLNPEYAPRLAAVAPRGVIAIEMVSGCGVRRIGGDQVVMKAWLDCGGKLRPLPQGYAYDCEFEETNEDFGDLICEPLP